MKPSLNFKLRHCLFKKIQENKSEAEKEFAISVKEIIEYIKEIQIDLNWLLVREVRYNLDNKSNTSDTLYTIN